MRNIPRPRGKRLIATAALTPLALTGLTLTQSPEAAASTTSPDWARLADEVPTPVPHWTTCQGTHQCATAELPLNYHDPHGAKIQLALLKVKAKDPEHRLGTIFVNPGGPGDTARDFAYRGPRKWRD